MRQNLSHIRLRGLVYHYRRRVPPRLVPVVGQTEFIRSLETSSAREARHRARVICIETDRAFEAMSRVSLAAEQVAMILRRLKSENFWNAPTREEILGNYVSGDRWTVDRLFSLGEEQIAALSEEEQSQVALHMRRLLEGVEQHQLAKRAQIAEVRAGNAELASAMVALNAEEAVDRLSVVYAERLEKAAAAPAPVPAPVVTLVTKSSPLFSARTEEFLQYKSTAGDDGRAYSNQTILQTRVTFKLWLELVGDKPVREYTREEVSKFRELLLQLPATHGKSGKVISAKEAIARRELQGGVVKVPEHRQSFIDRTPVGIVADGILSGPSP